MFLGDIMRLLMVLILCLSLLGCAEEQIVGGDKDEHGCIGSAGYTWCELKQECLRVWEETCYNAEGFCAEDTTVSDCGDFISVYREEPGAGNVYYYKDGSEMHCPVVAPEAVNEGCKHVFDDVECVSIC